MIDAPNFLKKDLSKLIDIILSKIESALENNERVELREIFTLETRTQRARISRNPKTQEKIEISKKKTKFLKFDVRHLWILLKK